ncbi:glycosyl hydrolase [Diplogelasinospora grovesii]|uniref:Glycosyl hydrolase n=1 Tax=Diplogelasinospora grovesii TaxID=303347 RepID=A0AAN6N515_9PEZI|nr:glycosyl hydrolase [Diplogelasinospora grovesii]
MFLLATLLGLSACITTVLGHASNSTFYNPILPGFHPDPSCIFVSDWDDTFFCASSSFNAFPGIPIHASKDLQNWKLIGHVLNRKEQLPRLAETNRSTSGIWAPALRYHDGTFWLVTTLVDDDRPQTDFSRWDNVIFKSNDPFNPAAWTNAVHFNFTGYDTSPFWDVDGKVYITGAHAWQVEPGLQQAEANLDTGEVGEWRTVWNGTGGLAPEGPHIYRKDGYYYLIAAEGGTGLNHMVTMARSKNINGPYESNPRNPVLTNANTTNYFQTVGHSDLFQDGSGNWWAVALSTRSGPEYLYYPMGRETVMTSVTWANGEFPIFSPINGKMSGWPMPRPNLDIDGPGPWISEADDINSFPSGSSLPAHFTYWRFPNPDSFTISPPERPGTLRIKPSMLNLTALNGNYAGPKAAPGGQSFVGRRQQDTLFTYSVDVSFDPKVQEEEAGVSVFLTQNHHLDLGIVMLPEGSANAAFPGTRNATKATDNTNKLVPFVRFRGISYISVPDPVVAPLPEAWSGKSLTLEINAFNMTHYSFAVGPADARSEMQTVMVVSNAPVSWGFTGTILGVYATGNGGNGTTPVYVSGWRYTGQGQFRD